MEAMGSGFVSVSSRLQRTAEPPQSLILLQELESQAGTARVKGEADPGGAASQDGQMLINCRTQTPCSYS